MSALKLTDQNDLAWLANSYALGELSVDQAAEFEARLATDEAACEAVAQAVQLSLAISVAMERGGIESRINRPEVVVLRSSVCDSPASTRTVGAAITAFATTAVVAAGLALMVGQGGPSDDAISHKDGADKIVAAWASGEAARNEADDDDHVYAHDDADLDPPDWLFAALTAAEIQQKLPDQDEVRDN